MLGARNSREKLGEHERTAQVQAPAKERPFAEAGIVRHFGAEPVRPLERLPFMRELDLGQDEARQSSFVDIYAPEVASMRDVMMSISIQSGPQICIQEGPLWGLEERQRSPRRSHPGSAAGVSAVT